MELCKGLSSLFLTHPSFPFPADEKHSLWTLDSPDLAQDRHSALAGQTQE